MALVHSTSSTDRTTAKQLPLRQQQQQSHGRQLYRAANRRVKVVVLVVVDVGEFRERCKVFEVAMLLDSGEFRRVILENSVKRCCCC
jgi:hypothetical protein